MPESEFHNVISKLGELTGIVQEGFRAVHQRQDTANGKLSRQEEKVNHLEIAVAKNADSQKRMEDKDRGQSSEKTKWLDRFWTIGLAVLCNVGLLVLLRTGIVDINPIPKTPQEIQDKTIELKAEILKLQAATKQSK